LEVGEFLGEVRIFGGFVEIFTPLSLKNIKQLKEVLDVVVKQIDFC